MINLRMTKLSMTKLKRKLKNLSLDRALLWETFKFIIQLALLAALIYYLIWVGNRVNFVISV